MNYIAVDVEWCGRRKTDPVQTDHLMVQLAAISMDKEYRELEKWSMIINPGELDDVDMAADAVKNIRKSRLEAGKPCGEALRFFSNWVAKNCILVVWDEDSFKVLRSAFLKARVKVAFVDVILLKTLCEVFYKRDNLQTVCGLLGVNRNEAGYHVAKEEVKCMAEIFAVIMKEYGKTTRSMKRMTSLAAHPFYSSKKQINIRMIHELCSKYSLEYQYVSQTLFIKTKFSYWYIETDGREIRSVFHENYNLGMKNQKSFKQSFHSQNRQFKSLSECLKYIYYHDQFKMERDVRRYYDSSIEKLFSQIEKQK